MKIYDLDKLLEKGKTVLVASKKEHIPLEITSKIGDCFYLCYAPNGHEWVLKDKEIAEQYRIMDSHEVLGISEEEFGKLSNLDKQEFYRFIQNLPRGNHTVKWKNGNKVSFKFGLSEELRYVLFHLN